MEIFERANRQMVCLRFCIIHKSFFIKMQFSEFWWRKTSYSIFYNLFVVIKIRVISWPNFSYFFIEGDHFIKSWKIQRNLWVCIACVLFCLFVNQNGQLIWVQYSIQFEPMWKWKLCLTIVHIGQSSKWLFLHFFRNASKTVYCFVNIYRYIYKIKHLKHILWNFERNWIIFPPFLKHSEKNEEIID